jgi:CBS domain containing-hemolysin-like protein
MKNIDLHPINKIDELATPDDYHQVTINSPALKVFTDFKFSKPFTIVSSTSAFDTEKLMLKAHVRLKFVINENNHFLGIVSLSELNKQNMIKKVAIGENLKDLSVLEFMIPREDLKAIEYSDLVELSIHDVIHLLQAKGEQHCLVLESERHRIRGIISSSDIARKLHIPLNIKNNLTFIDIFNSIA